MDEKNTDVVAEETNVVEPVVEPVVEAVVEPVVEPAVEPVAEAVVEETVVEASVETVKVSEEKAKTDNFVYNTAYKPEVEDKPNDAPMTMGDWVLTILALLIPCAGIILYFYWAFSKKSNINRRNYCRAYLIIAGIGLVLYLIFFAIFGIAMLSFVRF